MYTKLNENSIDLGIVKGGNRLMTTPIQILPLGLGNRKILDCVASWVKPMALHPSFTRIIVKFLLFL